MTRLLLILCFIVACGDKPQLAALCDDDDDCGGFVCQPIGASAQGQCTRNCQSDERCEEAYGEGVCMVTCRLECSEDSDCPSPTECFQGLCLAMCSDDTDCILATCNNGICEAGE